MKKLIQMAAILAAVLIGGCTTVEISAPGSLSGVDVKGAGGKADRAIMLGNEGYYLFHAWPIVSGDVSWDAKKGGIADGISFFSDEMAQVELKIWLLIRTAGVSGACSSSSARL